VEVAVIRFVLPAIRWSMDLPLIGKRIFSMYEWSAVVLVPQIDEVIIVEILDALAASNVDYFLAGGYGVDALVGSKSRFHGDLDIVLDRYQEQVDVATAALDSFGFRRVEPHANLIWMTATTVLKDARGCTVELVSLDVERICSAAVSSGEGGADHNSEGLTVSGRLDGKEVRCASAWVHRVLKRGKPLRPKDRRDLQRLSSLA
jgi:lincosamide nucleotidyltransferase A/C/D/E